MGPVASFIVSLFAGQIFSESVSYAKDGIIHYMAEKDFGEILNDFDKCFIEEHDSEIVVNKCDMGAMIEKRALLVSYAEKYLEQDNASFEKNLKQEFIDSGCEVIGDHSIVIKDYLSKFYDLVYWKVTKAIPNEYRAIINAYVNKQHDINQEFDQRLYELEKKRGQKKRENAAFDFSSYYDLIEKKFTRKKRGNLKKLVGAYSDEDAYINACVCVNNDAVPVLTFLENWFCAENYGTLLIYGEPGHGKSTLCNKAVVEFKRNTFLKDKARNVLSVSLNTGNNRRIINNGIVNIKEAFSLGDEENKKLNYSDCSGALLFMDGFDEFIDDAINNKTGITNIVSFMKKVDDIAFENDIHIVVLSRTIAVCDYLEESSLKEKSYKLGNVTEQQQDNWLKQHSEYDDYKEKFCSLRGNDDMRSLLGIPFLFRIIVHCKFDEISTNVVELYDLLIDQLMEERGIFDEDRKMAITELRELAYGVYCNDTDTVPVPKTKWNSRWILAFYTKQSNKSKIGFFHRSFYQYFIANFIYFGVINAVTEKKAEEIIGCFAERELDVTIRQYLSLMVKEKDNETLTNNLKLVVEALVRTEAYLNLIQDNRYSYGNAEKTKIGRTINIFRNTLHICSAFKYVIQIPFKEGLDVFLRLYPSDSIAICSNEERKANLTGTQLSYADLSETVMRGANLRRAKLIGANLYGSDLSGANLEFAEMGRIILNTAKLNGAVLDGADLHEAAMYWTDLTGAKLRRATLIDNLLSLAVFSGADLSGASLYGADLKQADLTKAILNDAILRDSDLSGADLSGAYLRNADLRGAILRETNLKARDLTYAKIDLDKKELIDPSIEGYETIVWEENYGND